MSSDADDAAGAALATLGLASTDELCVTALLDDSNEVIYFKDLRSRFIRVSRGCGELHGYAPEKMIGLSDADLFEGTHAGDALADEQWIIATGEPILNKEERERWFGRPDTWVASSKFPLRAADGRIIGTFGISRDVTARVLAQQEVARVEAQLRTVLDSSTDQIATYDAQLRYRYLNPAGERARGMSSDALLGSTDREIGMPAGVLDVWVPALERAIATGEPGEIEFAVDSGAGTTWYHTRLGPDRDAYGVVVGVIASTRDITAIKLAEQELAHRATHDALTGLANRALLLERIDRSLDRMREVPGDVAVCFVDVDDFKTVNDRYGHDAGDRVLIELATRLGAVARRDDTVARLGGDEFVMLCDRMPGREELRMLVHRLSCALSGEYDLGTGSIELSVSVGAAVAHDPRMDAGGLLARADAAMYRVKRDHHAGAERPSGATRGR